MKKETKKDKGPADPQQPWRHSIVRPFLNCLAYVRTKIDRAAARAGFQHHCAGQFRRGEMTSSLCRLSSRGPSRSRFICADLSGELWPARPRNGASPVALQMLVQCFASLHSSPLSSGNSGPDRCRNNAFDRLGTDSWPSPSQQETGEGWFRPCVSLRHRRKAGPVRR